MEICSTNHHEGGKKKRKDRVRKKDSRAQHLLRHQKKTIYQTPIPSWLEIQDNSHNPSCFKVPKAQALSVLSLNGTVSGSRSDTAISLGRLCGLGLVSSGSCRTKLAMLGAQSRVFLVICESTPSRQPREKTGGGFWCSLLLSPLQLWLHRAHLAQLERNQATENA